MNAFDKNTTAWLSNLAEQRNAMVSRVLALSAINSGSGNLEGLAKTHALLCAAFGELGQPVVSIPAMSATYFDASGVEQVRNFGDHIHLRKAGTFRRNIVLTGHMDTVFPVDSAFQIPTIRDNGTIHGPGVADMKGGLMVMLEALRAFELTPWARDLGWDIVINSDEEVGSLGSAALLAEVGKRCPVGLIFEPATSPDGTMAGARKGSGNLAARIAGRSAHAGRNPEDGRNAIMAAADMALRLDALRATYEGLSVNVAKIDGGAANNVVPDLAVVRWNMRVSGGDMQAQVERNVAAIIAEVAKQREVQIALSGGFYRPAKPMDARTERLFAIVEDAGRDLGLSLPRHDSGGVCDGNNLAAVGVAVVDTLGVRGGNIHSDQEYAIIDSLTERAQLTFLTLIKLAQEEALFQ
jgi:glutamate carboxypeptidase